MLHPIDGAPAARAPRFAASMMPGPPPVMIANPASPRRRVVVIHAVYCGSAGRSRADPKTETAGPNWESASKPSTNSPMIRKTLHASGAIDGARGAPGVAPRRNLSSSVSPSDPNGLPRAPAVAAPSSTRSGSAPRSPPRSESPPPASRCMICLLPDGAPRGELHLQPPANRHPLIQLLFRSTATRPFRSISPCEQGPRRGGQPAPTQAHPGSSTIGTDSTAPPTEPPS